MKNPLAFLVVLAFAASSSAEVGHRVAYSVPEAQAKTGFERAVAGFAAGAKPAASELAGRFVGPCYLNSQGERNNGVWSVLMSGPGDAPGAQGFVVLYPREGTLSQIFFDGFDRDILRLLPEPHDGAVAEIGGFGTKRRLTEEEYGSIWDILENKYASERRTWTTLQDSPDGNALEASYEGRYVGKFDAVIRRAGEGRFVAVGLKAGSRDLAAAEWACEFSAKPLPKPAR